MNCPNLKFLLDDKLLLFAHWQESQSNGSTPNYYELTEK